MRTTSRRIRTARLLLPGAVLVALTGTVAAGTESASSPVTVGNPVPLPSVPIELRDRPVGTDCERWHNLGLWDMIFPTCDRNGGGSH